MVPKTLRDKLVARSVMWCQIQTQAQPASYELFVHLTTDYLCTHHRLQM